MTRESICFNCVHYINGAKGRFFCRAYPKGEGIPDRIILADTTNAHNKIQDDQKGDFVFQENPKE